MIQNNYTIAKTLVKHYYINVISYLTHETNLLNDINDYDSNTLTITLLHHINQNTHNHIHIIKNIINYDIVN